MTDAGDLALQQWGADTRATMGLVVGLLVLVFERVQTSNQISHQTGWLGPTIGAN
jgi:hypothetical protein